MASDAVPQVIVNDVNQSIIRFNIDGNWTLEEMAGFLSDLNYLYMLLLFLKSDFIFTNNDQYESKDSREKKMRELRIRNLPAITIEQFNNLSYFETRDLFTRFGRFLPENELLRVVKIQYSSPGVQDLAGLGELIGHLKEFFLKIIDNLSNRSERSIKNRELELRNTQTFLEIREKYKLSSQELIELTEIVNNRQQFFEELVIEQKLISVKIIDQSVNEVDEYENDN